MMQDSLGARVRAVLFDLDGVLIDSLSTIAASMNHALETLGRAKVTVESIRALIGAPMELAAATLLGEEDATLLATFVSHYREHYGRTCAEHTMAAPGLHRVVERLAERWPLAVATSKPHVYAEAILQAQGVASRFRAIVGRTLALDRESKADVIANALARLGLDEVRGVVMVGDTPYDVEGARVHGIPTLGIASGMSGAASLQRAGARWIAHDLVEAELILERIDAEASWGAV